MYAKYAIYCSTESAWKQGWSTTALTTCPTNSGHTVRAESSHIVNLNAGPINRWYPVYASTSVVAGQTVSLADVVPSGAIYSGTSLPKTHSLDSLPVSITASAQLADNKIVVAHVLYNGTLGANVYTLSGTTLLTSANGACGTDCADGYLHVAPISATEFAIITMNNATGPTIYFVTISGGSFIVSSITSLVPDALAFGSPGTFGIIYDGDTTITLSFPARVSVIEAALSYIVFVPVAISPGSPRTITQTGTHLTPFGRWLSENSDTLGLQYGFAIAPLSVDRFVYAGDLGIGYTSNGLQVAVCIAHSNSWLSSAIIDDVFVDRVRDIAMVQIGALRYLIVYRQTVSASESFGRGVIFDVSADGLTITQSPTTVISGSSSGFQMPELAAYGTSGDAMLTYFNANTGGIEACMVHDWTEGPRPTSGPIVINRYAQAPSICRITGVHFALPFAASRYSSHGLIYIIDFDFDSGAIKPVGGPRGRRAIGIAANSASGDGADHVACRVINRGIIGGFTNLQSGRPYYAMGTTGSIGLVPIAADDSYDPQYIGQAVSATSIDVRL